MKTQTVKTKVPLRDVIFELTSKFGFCDGDVYPKNMWDIIEKVQQVTGLKVEYVSTPHNEYRIEVDDNEIDKIIEKIPEDDYVVMEFDIYGDPV
jgi:hypothetical protein